MRTASKIVWIGLIIIIVIGGSLFLEGFLSRPLDAQPVRSAAPRLAPGIATVTVTMETGGDQMSWRPVQAGLKLHVRYGETELSQMFANCSEAGLGEESGSTYGTDIACDGRSFDLITDIHSVTLREILGPGKFRTVSQIPLPSGIEKVYK